MAEIPDDEHYYLRALREELKLSSEIGMDEAARRTAEKLIEYADPPAVNYKANLLKYEINLKGNDAKAALELLKAAVGQYGRGAVEALSSSVIEETSNKVVLKVGGECPAITACDGDMALCEQLCRANEAHGILTNPEFILLTKEVNPGLRWKIHKFRRSKKGSCEYDIE